MFEKPIKHKALTSIYDIKRWSYRIYGRLSEKCVANQKNENIIFSDEAGCIYVTPYRPEIWGILEKAGYTKECTLSVPFTEWEESTKYKWLKKIAEEENWASTYEKAAQVAQERGIQPLKKVSKKYSVKEISSPYYDTETWTVYLPMIEKDLSYSSDKNVGTYVLVDEKTILVCDEYGKTYLLIKKKGVINAMVNSLINAGYTRTLHPEYFVMVYKK
jgi:hypothetical protein